MTTEALAKRRSAPGVVGLADGHDGDAQRGGCGAANSCAGHCPNSFACNRFPRNWSRLTPRRCEGRAAFAGEVSSS